MNRVIILENFTTSGRDFSRGEVYCLHTNNGARNVVLTNLQREFAVTVPLIDRDGKMLVEIVSQQMVEVIQKIQNGQFPRLSKLY